MTVTLKVQEAELSIVVYFGRLRDNMKDSNIND